ncbi:hypothetical protein CONPUDRAFT_167516 [Coniophora puteana RWD-64-598 SS2]|uniref:F-box domain-containing protein n=1 Tax=Coniophora puteana (strain RWD-64-598) TaxID=741705 RepID=A0A5M3MHV7_CONPW|nr:uncharacterized protein CONPUDRAFT_167516 [Coniophora puteana RWD-64-598 SS2]EIW78520.1 hypothetical protein CONPUDRAFT_167516 [Coniophora puteana RWD-64-598 SS2]
MHPALRLDEVVSIIARQGLSNGDLAVLARVSRSFTSHALDVLWYELYSMIPLLQCLPPHLVRVESQKADEVTLNCTSARPFTTADWDVFLKYARRVVHLHGASSNLRRPVTIARGEPILMKWDVDQSVFELLCNAPCPRPLLPKLRQLRWTDSTAQNVIWFLRFLLGPSVTELAFHTSSLDVPVLSLVSIIPTLCPSMKYFSWLNTAKLSNYAIRVSSDVACAWDGLRELTCPAISSHSLHRLSSLTFLEDLSINLAEPFPEKLNLSPDSVAFPSLYRLALSSIPYCSLAHLANYVKQMTLYPSGLTLRASSGSENEFTELLEVLSSDSGHEGLEYLRIFEFDTDPMPGVHQLLTNPMLRPVSRLKNMTDLTIDTDRGVMLDDAGILELVVGLPGLCTLSINEQNGWRTRPFAVPLVTMQGLRQIVTHLHDLERLAIAINAESSVIAEDDLKAAARESTHRNIDWNFSLNLLDSRVGSDNMSIVAAFLSDMFYNFQEFEFWSFMGLQSLDMVQDLEIVHEARVQTFRWSQVQSLVKVMQEIRRQEKARWTKGLNSS